MGQIIRLVENARKGNETAFLELFQEYENDIYRTAFMYVKNQDDALDVVQETAYRSFKAIKSLKEPKYFKTWLLKIAITSALELLRKRKKVVLMKPDSIEPFFENVGEEGYRFKNDGPGGSKSKIRNAKFEK